MVAWLLLACAAITLVVQYRRFRRRIAELEKQVAHSESHMQETNDRAERIEARHDGLLSCLPDAALVIDSTHRFTEVNQAACRWLRAEAAELLGTSMYESVRVAELHRLVEQVLTSGEAKGASFTLHGGGEREVEARAVPVRDRTRTHDDSIPAGVVVVLQDKTQLQRLEQIRQDFVANVSHELKTPITTIRGYVETILEGACGDEETAHRFLGIVARQSLRLEAIIEDLLTLARLEAGSRDARLRFAEEPLRPILQESIEIVRSKAESAGVRIDCRCDERLAARINAPLIEQALVNLIDNACKYSSKGGSVEVVAAPCGDGISIEVRDEGCGIEARHLARLFERFYRVDPSRSRQLGGTGLGLAIVKHIAQLHGGEVLVQSTPGKGSTFRLVLRS